MLQAGTNLHDLLGECLDEEGLGAGLTTLPQPQLTMLVVAVRVDVSNRAEYEQEFDASCNRMHNQFGVLIINQEIKYQIIVDAYDVRPLLEFLRTIRDVALQLWPHVDEALLRQRHTLLMHNQDLFGEWHHHLLRCEDVFVVSDSAMSFSIAAQGIHCALCCQEQAMITARLHLFGVLQRHLVVFAGVGRVKWRTTS